MSARQNTRRFSMLVVQHRSLNRSPGKCSPVFSHAGLNHALTTPCQRGCERRQWARREPRSAVFGRGTPRYVSWPSSTALTAAADVSKPSNERLFQADRRAGSPACEGGSLVQSPHHGPLRDVDVPAAVCMVLSVAGDANGARTRRDDVVSVPAKSVQMARARPWTPGGLLSAVPAGAAPQPTSVERTECLWALQLAEGASDLPCALPSCLTPRRRPICKPGVWGPGACSSRLSTGPCAMWMCQPPSAWY